MTRRASRRTFLKLSAAAASVGAVEFAHAAPALREVSIRTQADTTEPGSDLVRSEPFQWAVGKLGDAFAARGVALKWASPSASFTIHAATPNSVAARGFPRLSEVTQPETVALIPKRQAPSW